MNYTLVEYLTKKDWTTLAEISKQYKMRGYSIMEKSDLVEQLIKEICKIAKDLFCVLIAEDLDLWRECYSKTIYLSDIQEKTLVNKLIKWHLIIPISEKDEVILLAPKEIIQLYNNIYRTSDFIKNQHICETLLIVRDGLLNLYGAVDIIWFIKIYENEFNMHLTVKECLSWLKQIQKIYLGCKLIQEFIVHESLYFDSELAFYNLKNRTSHLNYYEPSFKEIELRSNELYYGENPYINLLRKHLNEHHELEQETIELGIASLVIMCRTLQLFEMDLIEEIIRQLGIIGINITLADEMRELVPIIVMIIRTTRTWRYRGQIDRGFKTGIDYIDNIILYVKINQNELCPCGSSKKYRYCCLN